MSAILQEKVACLDDNEARLAVDPHSKYRIQVAFMYNASPIHTNLMLCLIQIKVFQV